MDRDKAGAVSYCGIYCGACPSVYRGSCYGCRSEDKSQKRKSKWSCKIRNCCINEKNVQYCGECPEYPCPIISKLIKSHKDKPRMQYRHEIPNNMKELNEIGIDKWAAKQDKSWKCPNCDNDVIWYNYECVSCRTSHGLQKTFNKGVKEKNKRKATSRTSRVPQKYTKKEEKEKTIMKDTDLIARCGLYCGTCRSYLLLKKDQFEQRGYKQGCKGCKIRNKNCAFLKKQCPPLRKGEYEYCSECDEIPCPNLKKLNDGYVKSHGVSLVVNLERLREVGDEKWIKEQIELYKCPECGGDICIHDEECYDCGLKYNPNKDNYKIKT